MEKVTLTLPDLKPKSFLLKGSNKLPARQEWKG